MRDIRNYGVHPRHESQPFEAHFTEEASAFIILASRHHLVRLREAVAKALEVRKD
jgi:hypothetical protein